MQKLLSALNTVESGYLRRGLPAFDGRDGKYLYAGSSRLVNFSSNDYLGLSSDKELRRKAAALLGRTEMRLGSGSARLVSGSLGRYGEIEKAYGEYFGYGNSLFFPSGYQANIGLMSALFDPGDSVIVDKRLHASLVHGLGLAKAKLTAFRHADWKSFEKKSRAAGAPRAVVLESLYSMDGDALDISYIAENRSRFPLLIVDEAHALGVLGEKGKGLATGLAEIAIGTFGKAFGFHGAFILCGDRVKDYLVNFCPS
ncbi:MAG: aminotransferase class I/II-fold pyridoxal phosphate-dependent enzyme, partial [Elusimicrobia bacterium]|nr:aminotransferase class I/II-fold pyridoxal phosphate-dependent enzyme [Elusimicrobiota bacterium]